MTSDPLLTAKQAAAILGVKPDMSRANVAVRLAWYTMTEPNSGCHLFTGRFGVYGYGYIKVNGKSRFAHRVAYQLLIGPIPDGLVIDHLCRNKACVNPGHLEAVTQRENLMRGLSPSAVHARAQCCPNDHPYDTANTYRTPKGDRQCRTCHREHERQRRARRRAQA